MLGQSLDHRKALRFEEISRRFRVVGFWRSEDLPVEVVRFRVWGFVISGSGVWSLGFRAQGSGYVP